MLLITYIAPPLLLILGWHTAANAQGSGEVYAAPGMPVHLQRRAQPVGQPTAMPLLSPRFWKLKDSAYVKGAIPFYRYIGSHFRWPTTTVNAGIEGRLFVRLILLPDGMVASTEIVRRELTSAEGASTEDEAKAGFTALDAEATQFMKKLRFEPATWADTVVVPITFKIK